MKKIAVLLGLTLVTLCSFVSAEKFDIPMDISQNEKPATIKVLIGTLQDKMLLESKGQFHMYNPLTGLPITTGILSKRGWIRSSENGLVWGEILPGMHQIRIVPSTAQGSVLVNGIEYRGCIEIYDMKGKLHVVNEVDIERYLKSTLPEQIASDGYDDEVIDAIAITARTHAYYLATRKSSAYWHVDAKDVGYQGYALTHQDVALDRAINNTRFMVMTYQGEPFPAMWTQDSAGKTANYATVYRKDIKTPAGVDAGYAALDREKHAWSFTISKQELAKILGTAVISELDLYQDSSSKKVYGARIKDGTQTHQFDFAKLQTALGTARLKSNDFTIQTTHDKVHFKGFGEGTGVGLCLYSAGAMADHGERAPKMLSSFFPGSKLENMRRLEKRDL